MFVFFSLEDPRVANFLTASAKAFRYKHQTSKTQERKTFGRWATIHTILPLWQTTGRRRDRSTLWHGRRSRSTQLSSGGDFSFLSENARNIRLISLECVPLFAFVASFFTSAFSFFLSYLEHIKLSPLVRLPNREHVYQVGLCSVHFKHPALDLNVRREQIYLFERKKKVWLHFL